MYKQFGAEVICFRTTVDDSKKKCVLHVWKSVNKPRHDMFAVKYQGKYEQLLSAFDSIDLSLFCLTGHLYKCMLTAQL